MIGKVGTVLGEHGVNIASTAVGREPGQEPGAPAGGHRPPRGDGRDRRLADPGRRGARDPRPRRLPGRPRRHAVAQWRGSLALAPDLFFASKIDATLKAAGHEVTRSLPATRPRTPDVVIVDLDARRPADVAVPAGVPRLGFYSHVDVETRRRARGGRLRPRRAALPHGARDAGAGRLAAEVGRSALVRDHDVLIDQGVRAVARPVAVVDRLLDLQARRRILVASPCLLEADHALRRSSASSAGSGPCCARRRRHRRWRPGRCAMSACCSRDALGLLVQQEPGDHACGPRAQHPPDLLQVALHARAADVREDGEEEHNVELVVRVGKAELLRLDRAGPVIEAAEDVDRLEPEVRVQGRDALVAPVDPLAAVVEALVAAPLVRWALSGTAIRPVPQPTSSTRSCGCRPVRSSSRPNILRATSA